MKPEPILPTATVVYELTLAQRREIQKMQDQGMVAPEGHWQLKTLNILAKKGIAHVYGGPESPIFSLAPAWQEVDVSRKLPKHITLPSINEKPAIPKKKNFVEKSEKPDKEKPKEQRPRAEYSNASWEDNIHRILNTPI